MSELQRHWRSLWAPPLPPVSYRVRCACGQHVEGRRQVRAQTVACSSCGRPLFVLARSPLPALDSEPPPLPGSAASPWLLPIGAAVVTLGVAGALLVWLVTLMSRPPRTEEGAVTADAIRQKAVQGRLMLAEGNFREANKHYREADEMRARAPHLLGRDEQLAFAQQYRQADLLAHLLLQPLEDVVRHGQQSRRPEEWLDRFEEFKGRGVFLDDVIFRVGDSYQLAAYQVRSGGELARIDLNLTLLRRLEPQLPRRLLIGARLASVALERDGVWTIRFDPQSGVLLTDEGAAAACGLPLDAELKATLRWQAQWIENNP